MRTNTIQRFNKYQAPGLEYARKVLPDTFQVTVLNEQEWQISYPDWYAYDTDGNYTGNHLKYLDLLLVEEA